MWYGRMREGGGWEEEAGVSEINVIYGEQRGVCGGGDVNDINREHEYVKGRRDARVRVREKTKEIEVTLVHSAT